ncbi:MAG: asparagine synthase (glutamine-hydrolyzing) [Bacteroidota bacterium]|jgi:asparagine synthase (glutamine-hydrolysing)
MCGIAGVISTSIIEHKNLEALIGPIKHRGPDGSGIWINNEKNVGFAHRRLSIIDLSDNGSQPFHSQSKEYTITYNGEIYNYIEIREILKKKGHQFRTFTDTEVILAAFKEYGYDCLNYFDGMFAFALWDNNKQELFCARDRFGEKPFFYYLNNNRFVFASEIKQFWSYGIDKIIDPEKLERFLLKSEVIDDNAKEKTFYKNIISLKAAHFLIYKIGQNPNIKEYWNLKTVKINSHYNFHDASIKFLELLNKSIQYRLRSDVQVGSSLSGGLDSSAIVYSINSKFLKLNQKQFTFSARFNNYEKDEGEYIDALISELHDINRFDVFLNSDEFEKDIQQIIYHQDEPFQSASIFAQFKVMELVKKNNVTVLLDGQGADELLGGYETLYIEYLKQLFYNRPDIYTSELTAFNKMHGSKYGMVDLKKNDTPLFKLKRETKRLFNIKQAVSNTYFSNVLQQYICGAQLQQLLRYADRNAMAHSIETRLPFLNHELVEFCFTLPDQFKLKDGWPKFILRKVFDKKITDKIIWRKNKIGYETPENTFMQSNNSQTRIKIARQFVSDNKITYVANDWLLYMTSYYIN